MGRHSFWSCHCSSPSGFGDGLECLEKDESCVLRAEGLEPPRLTAPEPKSGASANFATPALWLYKQVFVLGNSV